MPAPEWGSFLSIVDGSLNPVPVSDLDEDLVKVTHWYGLSLTQKKKIPSGTG